MNFPDFPSQHYRSERPYIVTLRDGDRLPAYPAHVLISQENELLFGEGCQDKMWLVSDHYIQSESIRELINARVIAVDDVVSWEPISRDNSVEPLKSKRRHTANDLSL